MSKSVRILAVLIVLAIAILACQSTDQTAGQLGVNPIATVGPVSLPQSDVATGDGSNYAALTKAVVPSGEGILVAIERACGCQVPKDFANLGMVLVRQTGAQICYTPDKRSLLNIGFFDGSGLCDPQPGDNVYFGKVADVAKAIKPNIVTVTSVTNASGQETVTATGGKLRFDVQILIGTDRDVTFIANGNEYPTGYAMLQDALGH